MLLGLLVVAASATLYTRSQTIAASNVARDVASATALAEAKRVLIASAVTAYPASGKRTSPGLLPFPDRARDGNYDGQGDCVTFGLLDAHLLGRFPGRGDVSPCPRIALNVDIRDGSGERLWYAVSRNLVNRGGGGPVNPDMGASGRAVYPWISVRDLHGRAVVDASTGMRLPVAAVILAPGAAVEGQDRSAEAPAAGDFLDGITIGATGYDNADADGCPDAVRWPCGSESYGEEFIIGSSPRIDSAFNDRLVYIGLDELMRAVEKRVLGDVAVALNRYRREYGVYPWLAGFDDPARATFKSTSSRRGFLTLHLPDEIFSTGFGGYWQFLDATPSTKSWHSGDPALAPPLADLRAGRIRVSERRGRCRWSDWTRADCRGVRIIRNYLRVDLDRTVTRTLEYAFSILDATPEVTPPTPTAGRLRALSVSGSPLPAAPSLPGHASSRLPAVAWNIRITDDDGVNRGRREMRIDADTAGAISLTGIRFDLSIVYDAVDDERDELPEWFARNSWHHFVQAAFSGDAVAGGDVDGDGDCSTPVNTCLGLRVDGTTVRRDIAGLVVSAGAELRDQNRAVGDCDGDGVRDDFLCAYFEGDNSDRSTALRADIYARDSYSAGFNDQIRIIEPSPR
jgi:hypothetical protein